MQMISAMHPSTGKQAIFLPGFSLTTYFFKSPAHFEMSWKLELKHNTSKNLVYKPLTGNLRDGKIHSLFSSE